MEAEDFVESMSWTCAAASWHRGRFKLEMIQREHLIEPLYVQ